MTTPIREQQGYSGSFFLSEAEIAVHEHCQYAGTKFINSHNRAIIFIAGNGIDQSQLGRYLDCKVCKPQAMRMTRTRHNNRHDPAIYECPKRSATGTNTTSSDFSAVLRACVSVFSHESDTRKGSTRLTLNVMIPLLLRWRSFAFSCPSYCWH